MVSGWVKGYRLVMWIIQVN